MKGLSRGFIKASGMATGAALLGIHGGPAMASEPTRVASTQTEHRAPGVRSSLAALDINPVKAKDVLLKPNFDTADPTPGSTHTPLSRS